MTDLAHAFAAARHWTVVRLVQRALHHLTQHHALHALEPIGMYAGSLLPRETWDHS